MEARTEKTDYTSSDSASFHSRFCVQHFKPLRTEDLVCEQPARLNCESARQAKLRIELWPVIRNYRNGTGTRSDS
jgi:hypothetical protein